MAARAALDLRAVAELAGDVARERQPCDVGGGECDVVQPGTGSREQHDVVGIALALEEDGDQRLAVHRHVLADAEAELGVEARQRVNVGNVQLEVIEAQRAPAAVEVKPRQQPRLHRHPRAELERHPSRIGHAKRATLERSLDPYGRESLARPGARRDARAPRRRTRESRGGRTPAPGWWRAARGCGGRTPPCRAARRRRPRARVTASPITSV